jgi:hypothetical protein
MPFRRRLALVALALAAAWGGAQAQTGFETAGVRYPSTASLGGSTLVLNGAGVRYKAIFKVYAAGLYLTDKAATPEAALAAKGPARVHVVMLRDIDANELGRLFTRGMQDNSPREEFVQMIPGTIKMGEIFAAKKRLLAGDAFFIDWVPNVGTTVVVNGKSLHEPIRERAFFSGLLRIWLGKSPPDEALKESMLGRPPQRRNPNDGGN